MVCKVLLKSCADSTAVIWAVISTFLKKTPKFQAWISAKRRDLEFFRRSAHFLAFSKCAKASLYLWICLHQEIPLKQGWISYHRDMHSSVSHVSCWHPLSGPAEESVQQHPKWVWFLRGTPSGVLCHDCKAHAVNVWMRWGFLHQCCAGNSHQLLNQLKPGTMWAVIYRALLD